jgi:hypothetical protein
MLRILCRIQCVKINILVTFVIVTSFVKVKSMKWIREENVIYDDEEYRIGAGVGWRGVGRFGGWGAGLGGFAGGRGVNQCDSYWSRVVI